MFEHTNLEATRLEHQLAVYRAGLLGQHLPLSRARQALVERHIARVQAPERVAKVTPVFSFPPSAELLPS